MLKKVLISSLCVLLTSGALVAQDSTMPKSQSPNKDFPNISDSFKEMQKQMEEQMKKFFGDEGGGFQSFSFKMDTTFRDTSFSKSYGFMFDGKNWKSLTPNTEGGDNMGDVFKQMQERMKKLMPDMGKGFDMDMFKGFGDMSEGEDSMPRVQPQPKPKKRLGDEEAPKNEKYKTEKL